MHLNCTVSALIFHSQKFSRMTFDPVQQAVGTRATNPQRATVKRARVEHWSDPPHWRVASSVTLTSRTLPEWTTSMMTWASLCPPRAALPTVFTSRRCSRARPTTTTSHGTVREMCTEGQTACTVAHRTSWRTTTPSLASVPATLTSTREWSFPSASFALIWCTGSSICI